ncbi:MAG: ribosomal protein S18-alanine N-acetyltransferase [Gammaproteobacteria bacterium]|nr:ribosomal protein S18-alanine N-acetyltransferase [Gammaproteobacteria bacterium]
MSAILKQTGTYLRLMKEADLAMIMRIERRAYEYPWSEGIFRDCLRVGYHCWVYVQGGMIEAYGVMSIGAGEAHVLNLCVSPESQRQGLGRKVLAHLLGQALRLKADTVLLEVRPSNHAALALYRSMGFNEVGVRKEYYPTVNGREDALILAKCL